MPLISVIVPVYNVEPYLRRCIDSILSQTFTDFELILVDDGSLDNCPAICDQYALEDGRIHVIHQENGGLSAARNAGLDYVFDYSDNEWVSFVDSDDWVDDHYLEFLYKAASNNVNISLIGFKFVENDCQDRQLGLIEYRSKFYTPEEYYSYKRVNAIVAWGKLYKKQLFANTRYPIGKINEDEFVTYRLLFSEAKIAVVDCELYMYFQNPNGIMKSEWSTRRLDVIEALEDQMKFFRNRGYSLAYECVSKIYISALVTNITNIQEIKGSKEIIHKLLRKLRLKLVRERYLLKGEEHRLWCYDIAFPRLMNIYWIMKNKIGRERKKQ